MKKIIVALFLLTILTKANTQISSLSFDITRMTSAGSGPVNYIPGFYAGYNLQVTEIFSLSAGVELTPFKLSYDYYVTSEHVGGYSGYVNETNTCLIFNVPLYVNCRFVQIGKFSLKGSVGIVNSVFHEKASVHFVGNGENSSASLQSNDDVNYRAGLIVDYIVRQKFAISLSEYFERNIDLTRFDNFGPHPDNFLITRAGVRYFLFK